MKACVEKAHIFHQFTSRRWKQKRNFAAEKIFLRVRNCDVAVDVYLFYKRVLHNWCRSLRTLFAVAIRTTWSW